MSISPAATASLALRYGVVTQRFVEKGFGFLDADDHCPRVFVHVTSLYGARKQLLPGQRVTFDTCVDRRTGRIKALTCGPLERADVSEDTRDDVVSAGLKETRSGTSGCQQQHGQEKSGMEREDTE